MSENHEVEGNEPSSESEVMDDLFLSPDDSDGEEIVVGEEQDAAPAAEAAPPQEPAPAPAAPAVDPRDTDEYKAVVAERDDFKNRMMRTAADLENFRKRSLREKDDLRKYGIDRVVLELLPVLDNLERALAHAGDAEDSTIVDGVRMVQRQFVGALEKHGVKGFDAKGEQFDPTRHEAIQQLETTEHPTGTVVDEYQKGYYLHDRLIRPALVVVARNSGPAAPPADEAPEPVEEDDDIIDMVTDEPASEPGEGTDADADDAELESDSEESDPAVN